MCEEEHSDGKTFGGGISSITHQLVDQTASPIYLAPCWALRDVFFFPALGAYISILLFSTSPHSLFFSLLRMDGGECVARNSVHPSLLHWQGWPVHSSVRDAIRRLHTRFTQEAWSQSGRDKAAGWLDFSEKFLSGFICETAAGANFKECLLWVLLCIHQIVFNTFLI